MDQRLLNCLLTVACASAGTVEDLKTSEFAGVTTVRGVTIRTLQNGQYFGQVAPINAADVPDSPGIATTDQVRLLGEIGPDMRTSLDEAVRAVKSIRPKWSSHIEVSFSEKYAPKDGGSAATAFACALLSLIDGVPLSQDVVVTGDIDVAGKVLRVGAVPDKIRGAMAAKAALFVLPSGNDRAATDLALLDSWKSIWEVQIFSVGTLPDALAVLRKSRDLKVDEAVDSFARVAKERLSHPNAARPKLDESERECLQRVVAACPSHLSARLLLQRHDGHAPTSLTVETSVHETLVEGYAAIPLLASADVPVNLADSFGATFVRERREALERISRISQDKPKELADAFIAFLVEIEKAGAELKTERRKRELGPTVRFGNNEHPFYQTQRRLKEVLISLGQDPTSLRKFDSGR